MDIQERLTDKEALYTIRTIGHMNGYASQMREDGYCETLGMFSHGQAIERLHAQGYERVRYLSEEEFEALALRRREQNRPVESVSRKQVTAFDIFCLIAEIMELREQRRLMQELKDAGKEELRTQV
jgi:hypothetical protein